MKLGDRVTGTVKAPAVGPDQQAQHDFKPEGPIVEISGDGSLLVYTQYGGVWRIPAADCQLA